MPLSDMNKARFAEHFEALEHECHHLRCLLPVPKPLAKTLPQTAEGLVCRASISKRLQPLQEHHLLSLHLGVQTLDAKRPATQEQLTEWHVGANLALEEEACCCIDSAVPMPIAPMGDWQLGNFLQRMESNGKHFFPQISPPSTQGSRTWVENQGEL